MKIIFDENYFEKIITEQSLSELDKQIFVRILEIYQKRSKNRNFKGFRVLSSKIVPQILPESFPGNIPADTGRKLNVHITSWTSSERLMYVQFTSCVFGDLPLQSEQGVKIFRAYFACFEQNTQCFENLEFRLKRRHRDDNHLWWLFLFFPYV